MDYQLMSKEFSNEKWITSKHDDMVSLVNEKGITKLNRKLVTGLMIGERFVKWAVEDNNLKGQEDLDGSKNQVVEARKKFWMTQIIQEIETNGL